MIEIKDLYQKTLYTGDHDTLGQAVEAAVKSGVSLAHAELRHARLGKLDLQGGDFGNADLAHADLEETNLTNACLVGTNLRGARIHGTNLSNTNLRGASLTSVCMSPRQDTFDPFKSCGCVKPRGLMLQVAKAALQPGALDMRIWHMCTTQHCLAGWAVHLVGPTGYTLEKLTSPSVAGALLIPEAAHLFYNVDECIDNPSNNEVLKFCQHIVDINYED